MNNSIARFGFWSALIAFAAASGYSISQILQVAGVVRYPLDGILIYGFSLLIATPFMLAILALHYMTPEEKRFWSHGALLFAVIYTMYVSLNYVVQLATVIPASLQNALDPIRVLDQTPHSLFWDVDGLGYIFMGFSTLFAAQTFAKEGLQKWLRWFFIANALMTPLVGVVYFYPVFSVTLLFLAFPWGITAPGSMLLLALFFRRKS